MSSNLNSFIQQQKRLEDLRNHEETVRHRRKTVIDYISAKGSVVANAVQISEDLFGELSMASGEMAFYLSELERCGHLKYEKEGYYSISEGGSTPPLKTLAQK